MKRIAGWILKALANMILQLEIQKAWAKRPLPYTGMGAAVFSAPSE